MTCVYDTCIRHGWSSGPIKWARGPIRSLYWGNFTMANADEGFDEHVEIWGLGDMDCKLFGEDLWKEWKIRENNREIAEKADQVDKIIEKIQQNNRKIWSLGNIEFWIDDDDDEKKENKNEWDEKVAEIIDENNDAFTQYGLGAEIDTFDEEKKTIEKHYETIVRDYLEDK